MVAAVEQTDPRTQPGAVVKVPSGARCFVTGVKNDRVLVDYESRTLGSDAYPLHLLTLIQEAPTEEKKLTRPTGKVARHVKSPSQAVEPTTFKTSDRVVWEKFPNAVYEVMKAGKARAIIKLIEEVNPGNKLAPEEKSVPVEELSFSTAQNQDDNPLEFCSEVVLEAHSTRFKVGDRVDVFYNRCEEPSDSGEVLEVPESGISKLYKIRTKDGAEPYIEEAWLRPVAVIEAEIVVSRSEQLRQLEAEIEQGTAAREKAERQIWIAAAQIKSEKLWREAGFDSFEAYCRDRFGWEKSNAYEVAGAGEVVLQLQAAGAEEIPNSVAAVQVLKKVAPESRLQVLQTAKEESGKLTADALKQAVVKTKEPAPDPYEYQPIEPKACWFLEGSNWVEGQAIAKNQRELYRVVWGEDRETAIPAQRLQWTAPIVIPPPAERLAPPVTGRDWMEGDQVSGVDDNGEPVEGVVWVVGPGYLRLKDNRVCYQPKLINFAPVDAEPAIEETSTPAEPEAEVEESDLKPEEKTLLHSLKNLAQFTSDDVYKQLVKLNTGRSLDDLLQIAEEVEEAVNELLEFHFL